MGNYRRTWEIPKNTVVADRCLLAGHHYLGRNRFGPTRLAGESELKEVEKG